MTPRICALLLTALAAVGCSADASDELGGAGFVYENPVFQDTTLITAAAQVGPTEGTPAFSWPATNFKHVVVAIFDERIGIKDDAISNPHRIRWMWHSGLPTGREGNVLFEHGVSDVQTAGDPEPLPRGTYYWAVWTIDSMGVPARSSIEYTVTIPPVAEASP